MWITHKNNPKRTQTPRSVTIYKVGPISTRSFSRHIFTNLMLSLCDYNSKFSFPVIASQNYFFQIVCIVAIHEGSSSFP